MLTCFLILLSSLLCPPTGSAGPYSGVVVNAVTGAPVASVSVRDSIPGLTAATLTDAAGHFTLAARPARLARRCLGYPPLTLNLAPAADRKTDTLRLFPLSYLLQNVTVQRPRTYRLTSAARGRDVPCWLLPGQKLAQVLRRPPELPLTQSCVLRQVRLHLRGKPRAGRLCLRLVELRVSLFGELRPEGEDLLPRPLVFSPAQLAQLSDETLTVDLEKYNLLLPPDGLALVVEVLATDSAATDTHFNVTTMGRGRRTLLAVAVGAAPAEPVAWYPHLLGRADAANPYWRYSSRQSPSWVNKNPPLSLALHTELEVLIYP